MGNPLILSFCFPILPTIRNIHLTPKHNGGKERRSSCAFTNFLAKKLTLVQPRKSTSYNVIPGPYQPSQVVVMIFLNLMQYQKDKQMM